MTDIIFCHSGPFFSLFTHITTQKIKIFKKMKKLPGDIITLHRCNINDNHIINGSWDTKQDRKNFCHFRPFLALLPTYNPKNKNFEKMKKNTWRYYHFKHVYHKWQSYDVCFLRYWGRQTEFFVILDNFLPLYPPNNLKNQNFQKMKKITGDIIILHMCTKNYGQMM